MLYSSFFFVCLFPLPKSEYVSEIYSVANVHKVFFFLSF